MKKKIIMYEPNWESLSTQVEWLSMFEALFKALDIQINETVYNRMTDNIKRLFKTVND